MSGYPLRYDPHPTGAAYAWDDTVNDRVRLEDSEAHPRNSGGPVRRCAADGRGGAGFGIATSHAGILGWIASNDHLTA